MTNQELADLLNAELGLTGRAAVTPNVIRKWVLWDVLPTATPSGRMVGQAPEWTRDDNALARARRLAEIRRYKVVRETAVIAQAYIEWGYPDFDRARSALLSEFCRGRNRLFKSISSCTDFADASNLSKSEKSALSNQAGPLEINFVKDRIPKWDNFYLNFMAAMRSGNGNFDEMQVQALQIFSDFPRFLDLKVSGIENFISSALIGFFGDPDELANTGQQTLEQASEQQFQQAQTFIQQYFFGQLAMLLRDLLHIDDAPIMSDFLAEMRPIFPQISCGDWINSIFVSLLHFIYKNNGINPKIVREIG